MLFVFSSLNIFVCNFGERNLLKLVLEKVKDFGSNVSILNASFEFFVSLT